MINQGALALDKKLRRLGVTRQSAEVRLEAARGTLSRLLSGERSPGRDLSLRIFTLFGVRPSLWSEPAQRVTEGG